MGKSVMSGSINFTVPLCLQFILKHHELIGKVGLHVDFLDELGEFRLFLLLPLQSVPQHQDLLATDSLQELIVVDDGASVLHDAQPHKLVLFRWDFAR
jgi:hypothetical protein